MQPSLRASTGLRDVARLGRARAERRPLAARLAEATRPLVDNPAILAMLLLGVALAARAVQFGNPVVQVDDEFYLLVGDRMLHGALPFVDIWDRKPVGLFLIYAAIRLLGGEGVIQYQLVATLFAAATGFVVARIARHVSGAHGAAAAGVVYILYLGVFGGEGGQSPVFYNLFVALAAWWMIALLRRPRFDRGALAGGAGVMLLVGLALQVKYSAVFEGMFFGLALLWNARRRGATPLGLSAAAALWAGVALLPTLAAWGAYAALGHSAAFVQANFLSILARSSDGLGPALKRLGYMAMMLSPLAAAVWLGRGIGRARRGSEGETTRQFLEGWAIASVAGVVVFGTYFDHYALPMLVPLSVLAAPLFGEAGSGVTIGSSHGLWRVPAGLAVMIAAVLISIPTINDNRRDRGWGPQVEEIAAYVRPRLGDCLYVYDGDPSLYRLTGSCLPTRWPFPSHLTLTREADSLGIDPLAEMRRIMAGRPRFVVASTRADKDLSPRARQFMEAELARDYALVLGVPVGSRMRVLYERRPDK